MAAVPPIVYVIDDDGAVRRSLGRLLDVAGYRAETYGSAEAFLQRHDPGTPGCAVVDLGLPGMDGFGVQDVLGAAATERPVIFLTGRGDISSSVRAMKAGAVDFLTKPVDPGALLQAVETALALDREARDGRARRDVLDRRIASLTPRERQVLEGVVAGRLNKQIAAQLGTAEKTVKVHRGRMMAKMGVRTVADLVRLTTTGHP